MGGLAMDYPCDISSQSCNSSYVIDIHSRMLKLIADAAIDVSNSEVLDYPSIESIKLNTNVVECENKYAQTIKEGLSDPGKFLEELLEEDKEEFLEQDTTTRQIVPGTDYDGLVYNDDNNQCENPYFAKFFCMPNKEVKNPKEMLDTLLSPEYRKANEIVKEKAIKGGEINILLDGMEISDTTDILGTDGYVLIISVESNSNADRAKLEAGDIILGAVGNMEISDLDEFKSFTEDKDILILRVKRNGRQLLIRINK